MKKIIKALKNVSVLVLLLVAFIACDKDFSTIDSDLQGEQNFSLQFEKFPIIAYSKTLDPVQTNNLPSNLLGVYKGGSIDGTTTASVVTQIRPNAFNPDFGTNAEIESVFLTLPFYSHALAELDEDGNATYEIDSLFGNSPIKLSVYKNNYFLRSLDPDNIDESQLYYSNANQTIDFDSHIGEMLLDIPMFVPSSDPIIITQYNEETMEDEEINRIPPGIRIELLNPNGDFWESLLSIQDNMPGPEFSNINNFNEFFRGLYFKVESIDNDGHMLMLDFDSSLANITINYKNDGDLDDDGEIIRVDNTFLFNFTGNRVNTFENNFTTPLTDGDEIFGDENLVLKGGEGSMAVINLFNGENFDDDDSFDNAFETFKKSYAEVDNSTGNFIEFKRLINEVNLVFYVNQDMVEGSEPDRVTLYDLKNNTPIIDYFFDGSTNSADPLVSKIVHSTLLEREDGESDGAGIKYKIRLTEHLNNLLINDSTNVSLGLAVSTNVNELQNSKILDNDTQEVSVGTVLSPRGTILYGSHSNVPEEKRVQLEIFYTQPD